VFHAGIGEALGISIRAGERESLRGVVGSATGEIFYHQVVMEVTGERISVTACFSYDLPLPALLGRGGFFDHFRVTFDSSLEPPGMHIDRLA